ARPGYLARWLRSGTRPGLTVPNMAAAGGPAPGFFAAYRAWQQVKPPSWADIAWLRGQWDGPFMIKGIMRPDDARRAVDIGATAGVANVFEILRAGLDSTLLALGRQSIRDLTPDDVILPSGFTIPPVAGHEANPPADQSR